MISNTPCCAFEKSKFCFGQNSFNSGNSERHEELEDVVDDLDPAEDGEAGEETHGASDKAELSFQCQFDVPLNLVVAGRDKVDLDQVQWREPFG